MNNTITALIADDEPLMRFHLKKQLLDLWPDLHIIAQAENGLEAVQLCNELQPNIIFLDIKMPGMDGLEAAHKLRMIDSYKGHIVFITAYDQYAIEAFEREAIDYLLKPIDDKRLLKTIKRLQQKQQPQAENELNDSLQRLLQRLNPTAPATTITTVTERLKWVKALHNDEVYVIPVEEILFFQAGDKYTTVTTQSKDFLIRKPIKELEQELDPDNFWRIHRSYIVRTSCIKACKRDLAGRLSLQLQDFATLLPVSRSYGHLFKQM